MFLPDEFKKAPAAFDVQAMPDEMASLGAATAP